MLISHVEFNLYSNRIIFFREGFELIVKSKGKNNPTEIASSCDPFLLVLQFLKFRICFALSWCRHIACICLCSCVRFLLILVFVCVNAVSILFCVSFFCFCVTMQDEAVLQSIIHDSTPPPQPQAQLLRMHTMPVVYCTCSSYNPDPRLSWGCPCWCHRCMKLYCQCDLEPFSLAPRISSLLLSLSPYHSLCPSSSP